MNIRIFFTFAKGRYPMPKGSHRIITRLVKNCSDVNKAKREARKMFPNPLYKIDDYRFENESDEQN